MDDRSFTLEVQTCILQDLSEEEEVMGTNSLRMEEVLDSGGRKKRTGDATETK